MFYLLENPGGHPDYYQEHCYNEPVDVYYGFALVQNPDTVSQLQDRKSTRLNSSHIQKSRMPSSA